MNGTFEISMNGTFEISMAGDRVIEISMVVMHTFVLRASSSRHQQM
jgi:hypothetical protein